VHTPGNAQDLTRNLRGKMLRIRPDGGIPADNPIIGGRRTHVFAYGIRNSFGFTFDPIGGRLWETENGPACNDEINLITAGDNYGWGPLGAERDPTVGGCPADPSTAVPTDTNQDGPSPHLPLTTFGGPTIAATGIVFCNGCDLGAAYEGDLFAGCTNGRCKTTFGPVMHADLDIARTGFVNGPRRVPLRGFSGPLYSMEAAPGGRLFFSDATGIYRLRRA